jgi:purine-binding chemotaxis protein CheW
VVRGSSRSDIGAKGVGRSPLSSRSEFCVSVSSTAIATGDETIVREFLSFRLGDAEYGIDLLKVQEIRGCDPVTRIVNTPAFIKGVIDLRGIIVPIVDMRLKFQLERAEYSELTVVIILNVAQRVVGMVVDAVSDVITLGCADIKPVPEFSSALDTRFITGIGKIDERLIVLIDIERLIRSSEMALIDEPAA